MGRDLAALRRLDPVEIEEEGRGELGPGCRVGNLGARATTVPIAPA